MQSKQQWKMAEEHMKDMPRYTLSHVIKERYPSFTDALKDLDDALCLISMFATLPQHQTLELKHKDIEMAKKLYSDWMAYCTVAQCFKKVFFSIKGIYFQVELMGQTVTWVAPYQFNQRLPFEIDYKVINTFSEFYLALLRFTNFKLFKDIGIQYPLDESKFMLESDGIFLSTQKVQELQKIASKKFDEELSGSMEQVGVSDEFKNTPEYKQLVKK